MLSVEVLSTRI